MNKLAVLPALVFVSLMASSSVLAMGKAPKPKATAPVVAAPVAVAPPPVDTRPYPRPWTDPTLIHPPQLDLQLTPMNEGGSIVKITGDVPVDSNRIHIRLAERFLVSGTERKLRSGLIVSKKIEKGRMEVVVEFRGAGPGTYPVAIRVSSPKQLREYAPGYFAPDPFAAPYRDLKIINTDAFDWKYLAPSDNIDSFRPTVIARAETITKGLTKDYDKARAIHDWLVANISARRGGEDFTAAPILWKGGADSCGHAMLTTALLRAASIRARVVGGENVFDPLGTSSDDAHKYIGFLGGNGCGISSDVWTEALVDGRWILIDTAMDAVAARETSSAYFDPQADALAKHSVKKTELVEVY